MNEEIVAVAASARVAVFAWLIVLPDGALAARCERVGCSSGAAKRGEDRWDKTIAAPWRSDSPVRALRPRRVVGAGSFGPDLRAEIVRCFPGASIGTSSGDYVSIDEGVVHRRYGPLPAGVVRLYRIALGILLAESGLTELPCPPADHLELWIRTNEGDDLLLRDYDPGEIDEAMDALDAIDAVLDHHVRAAARLDVLDADGVRVAHSLGSRWRGDSAQVLPVE